MLINNWLFCILPLLLTGIIHHCLIIKYKLFSFLTRPIDGGKYWQGQRLFGQAKTWRGILVVIVLNSVFTGLLAIFFIPISTINPFIFGALLGLGYAIGEIPNSFIKRRLKIGSSQNSYQGYKKIFYFFDQSDSIIGAIVMLNIIHQTTWSLIIQLFIIGTLLHLAIDLSLYKFGYKKTKILNK
jgi:uncharacterized membrane protein